AGVISIAKPAHRSGVDGEDVPYWTALSHACRFNLTGHPAAVIPLEISRDGLPIGVQIVGKRWDDMRLLAITRALAGLTGGFRKPPDFSWRESELQHAPNAQPAVSSWTP